MISRNWFRNNLEWSIFRKVIWVEIFKSWKWRSRKFYVNCFCWVMKIILYYMIRIVIINIKIIIMMSFLFFFWKRFVMEVNMLPNVRRYVVRNSQGTCFNNIHPLNFSLVKAAATAPLRGLLCQSLCARGRTRLRELRVVNCECLELRVVGTAGVDCWAREAWSNGDVY